MGVPLAEIVHRAPERLRVRIRERRRDGAFFQIVADKLGTDLAPLRIEVNPQTGSLLISGGPVDTKVLADRALAHRLFRLPGDRRSNPILRMNVAAPLRSADAAMQRWSGGTLDLPGGIFAALILFGIIELLRGNWKTPPWYTAFWYAFGLYSRAIFTETRDHNETNGGVAPPEL